MFYPSTYGHEAPSNTKVNQTLKTHLKPSGDFSFEICPAQQMNSEAGYSYIFTPLSMRYCHEIITVIILKISYLSRFGWAMITIRNESHGIGMVHYSHFPVKDPTWSLNVHSSNGCQAMNLSWKHNSHFFPRLRFDSFHCLNLETWSDGNWRKHGHCRRHRPPKSQSWKAAFQDFNHENFHFINSSYEFKTPWGSNPNLHKRILEPYSLYFGYTWILTDGIPIVTPAETYPFPCRKSWFVAPPQGAVCSTAWSRKGSRSPEYFNLSWGLPGGSSPLQL